jgi:hypothetical protein
VAMRTRAIGAPSAVRTRPPHLRPVPGGTRGV